MAATGLSRPGVSKHLRVRRDAQGSWHTRAPEPLVEPDAWPEPYRRLWSGRLDALESPLDCTCDPAAGTPR